MGSDKSAHSCDVFSAHKSANRSKQLWEFCGTQWNEFSDMMARDKDCYYSLFDGNFKNKASHMGLSFHDTETEPGWPYRTRDDMFIDTLGPRKLNTMFTDSNRFAY